MAAMAIGIVIHKSTGEESAMHPICRFAGAVALFSLALPAEGNALCVAARDMNGVWKANDGGTYFVRQIGNDIWWLGMSSDNGKHWTNVYKGVLNGNNVTGAWADVPRGSVRSGGPLNLRIARGTSGGVLEFRKVGASPFGGSRWSQPCNDT